MVEHRPLNDIIAYAIQTLGSSLVERLEGSVSNVVGLPVGLLAELTPQLFERA